jgi:hypothetical protein
MKTEKWTESFEFSRAKASEFKVTTQAYLKLFLFYLVLFIGLGLFISVHGTAETLVGAVVVSLFFLGFTWLVNFLPKGVYVNKNGIGSGKTLIPYKNIDMAVIGTMELKGKTFDILSVITTGNVQHLYGLSAKINPQKLSETLKAMGVNVQ